jgi:hypothetical protein
LASHHQPFFYQCDFTIQQSSNLNLKNEVIFGIFNHQNTKRIKRNCQKSTLGSKVAKK